MITFLVIDTFLIFTLAVSLLTMRSAPLLLDESQADRDKSLQDLQRGLVVFGVCGIVCGIMLAARLMLLPGEG